MKSLLSFNTIFTLFIAVLCTMSTSHAFNITVIGSHYVGLATAALLTHCGHTVVCVDTNQEKIARLQNHQATLYEPGLDTYIFKAYDEGNLSFTHDLKDGAYADIIYICVGTPTTATGECDTSAVFGAFDAILAQSTKPTIVCLKSTSPPGTSRALQEKAAAQGRNDIRVIFNPEFMRAGSALNDIFTKNPVILGGIDEDALETMQNLYAPLYEKGIECITTTYETAEIIKYSWNSFSAIRIAYINELGALCQRYNADIFKLIKGVSLSERLLPTETLKPGPGYGGSCLPKDTSAFTKILENAGLSNTMVHQAIRSNDLHIANFIDTIVQALDNDVLQKNIAVLGLSFKANTDDIRNAPSLTIIQELKDKGANIYAYDPQATNAVKAVFPDLVYTETPQCAVEQADCIIIVLTDWPEIRELDLTKLSSNCSKKFIFDPRNLYDPKIAALNGYNLYNLGRI